MERRQNLTLQLSIIYTAEVSNSSDMYTNPATCTENERPVCDAFSNQGHDVQITQTTCKSNRALQIEQTTQGSLLRCPLSAGSFGPRARQLGTLSLLDLYTRRLI